MKNIQEANPIKQLFKEVGEAECEYCGNMYKLYETPKGTLGACKPCEDEKLQEKFNLPTTEEYKSGKKSKFIAKFEQVTADLEDVTVNTFKPDPKYKVQGEAKYAAIKFVKEFHKNKDQSLVFSGSPGLGKSHLAYAICKAIRKDGYTTLFIKSTKFLEHLRSTYNFTSNVTEEQLFKMIAGIDLLVLDDVGSEYVKANEFGHESWASDVLFRIYDSRLRKATITTTNYSEGEMKVKYGNNGPRILSRMSDGAQGFRMEGEDMRRKAFF